MVQAFRDNGLEVDPVMNVDDAPSWQQFMGPKTYREGTHENTTGMLHSWVYTKDDMILHIGNVPKSTAEAYDKVFESIA